MSEDTIKVLVYSGSSDTRQDVKDGVGRRPAPDLPTLSWVETATAWGAVDAFETENPGLLVLDAETVKDGGMSVARTIQDRFDQVPPIVILTARPQDAWLADWAGATEIVSAPFDPLDLQDKISRALRAR